MMFGTLERNGSLGVDGTLVVIGLLGVGSTLRPLGSLNDAGALLNAPRLR
jgi:hypothetical protein